jgi:glycosyltransferase involved in cell wall biosynthesis
MSDRIISLSDSHLANSRWLKNYQKKVVIIPNGVNLKEFQGANSKAQSRALLGLPTDKKIILFLGSLTARKGSQILVNAMNKVIAKSPNTVLVIVGDGSQKSKLQESINRLELNNAVILTGSVSENQKIAYYRSADIFTLPSFAEAFPLSLLEAGAAGLPVIATRVGGIPNIVEDGANGLLIEAGNCDDLADKISYLLDDGTLRETMGSTGRKMAAQYSWEAISDKTELLYFDILNRARLKKTLPTVP